MVKKVAKWQSKSGKVRGSAQKILKLLSKTPEGLRVIQIQKRLNLPSRTAYNALKKLKDMKLTENIFPIWRLCHSLGGSQKMANYLASSDSTVQLHNVSFVIKILKKPSWWDNKGNQLTKLKEYHFKKLSITHNPYFQLAKEDFVIQVFSNSIIFINRKNYYGDDSYDCFIEAVNDFLDEYKYFEEKLRFKFFYDNIPQVKIRSQHYVHIKNALAEKCKSENNNFEVFIEGKRRLWVDLSEPFGLEAGHPDFAPEDMSSVKEHYVDLLTKNPPKASEIANMMKEVVEIQKENAAGLNVLTNYLKSNLPTGEKKIDDKSLMDYFG